MATDHSSLFSLVDLIPLLRKWRKAIIFMTSLAFIASVIISYVIEPLYKSSVVLFPASTSSISKALFNENPTESQDLMRFGEEEAAEQLLQILKSDEIRDRVIAEFDLINHYKIDRDSKYPLTNLFKRYKENVKFTRTEYMAIKIEVWDAHSQRAADLANHIASLLDSVKTRMQQERALKGFNIVADEYHKLQADIRMMEDSMAVLRSYGIHDYESQAEVLNEAHAQALIKGNRSVAKELDNQLKLLAKYGGNYISLRDNMEHERKKLSSLKSKYEQARIDAVEKISHKFVVNKAFKSEKAAYPVKWLIVFISTVSTFILSILIIIVMDNYMRAEALQKRSGDG